MNYSQEPLSPEERQSILDGIHQREMLAVQALKEHKAELKAQAERAQREESARVARLFEEQRKANIIDLLNLCSDQLRRAIASFEDGDETETYRLLVRAGESRFSASEQLARSPERPTVSTGLPVVKIKANNPLGYAILNAEDFIEGIHQLYEEGTN
jgi:hypothetical protein